MHFSRENRTLKAGTDPTPCTTSPTTTSTPTARTLHGDPLGKYFIHGLGHYVGLYVHDAGDYDVPLAPGSVFTIEPGIYIPEEKLGVRIEDMYYVDASGKLIKLSAGLPQRPTKWSAPWPGSEAAALCFDILGHRADDVVVSDSCRRRRGGAVGGHCGLSSCAPPHEGLDALRKPAEERR